MRIQHKLGTQTCEQKLGRRVRRLREAIGKGRAEFAAAIGVNGKYLTAVEEGRLMLTAEMARRIVMYAWEGLDWRKSPTLPAQILRDAGKWRRNKQQYKKLTIKWPDTSVYREQYDAAKKAANDLGVSLEAFIMLCINRVLKDYPTMITLREGAIAYEQMRCDTVRQWFPEVAALLDGDKHAAQAIHEALGKANRERHVGAAELDPLSIFEQWSIAADGPATPVAPYPPRGWRPGKPGSSG